MGLRYETIGEQDVPTAAEQGARYGSKKLLNKAYSDFQRPSNPSRRKTPL